MGDTRGIKQDNTNCENILAYLGQLKDLHAICFLMKPTNTRITVLFEYCVKEILSRLEKSASRNLIFIFTNTRGTDYSPGETFPCMRKVIDDIKASSPHINIPFDENIFNFDNEAFRVLAAIKNGVQLEDSAKSDARKSWNYSRNESLRLISYILGDASRNPLSPHQIKNTKSINDARKLISQLTQPLSDISQLISDNIRILERHERSLNEETLSLEELRGNLYIPIINLQVTQLTQPVTVCTSVKCSQVYKVGDINKWHYRQRCHDPCYLNGIKKELIGDPGLVKCEAMSPSKTCLRCSCDFSAHMHIYYMTKTVDDKIVDDMVMSSIDNKEKIRHQARIMIKRINYRKYEFEAERQVIIKVTAQFAHFLQNNALTPYNNSYKKYIEYLIMREESLGNACDSRVVEDLQKLLQQYEEMRKVFEESLKVDQQPGNSQIDGIYSSIYDHLYKLKHNGRRIRELLEVQGKCHTNEHKHTEQVHSKIVLNHTKNYDTERSTKENEKNEDRHINKKKTKGNKPNKDKQDGKKKQSDGQLKKRDGNKVNKNYRRDGGKERPEFQRGQRWNKKSEHQQVHHYQHNFPNRGNPKLNTGAPHDHRQAHSSYSGNVQEPKQFTQTSYGAHSAAPPLLPQGTFVGPYQNSYYHPEQQQSQPAPYSSYQYEQTPQFSSHGYGYAPPPRSYEVFNPNMPQPGYQQYWQTQNYGQYGQNQRGFRGRGRGWRGSTRGRGESSYDRNKYVWGKSERENTDTDSSESTTSEDSDSESSNDS